MFQKNTLPVSLREYTPQDKEAVISLFRQGILEQVYPAFFKAMSDMDHIGVALSISMAGYVLGGSSYFLALLFGGAWLGLVYFCCHEIHEAYMSRRLDTDMADIQSHFLNNPDNRFWVAEAEVNGKCRVVGIVAVEGRGGGDKLGNEMGDSRNGGGLGGAGEIAGDGGDGSYGELAHLVVSFTWRRKGLGTQLVQKVVVFCQEHGFSRLVLDTSSPQTAAIALYRKLGFVQTSSRSDTHTNRWFTKLARISVLHMEKSI